jgi:hypothetical protein
MSETEKMASGHDIPKRYFLTRFRVTGVDGNPALLSRPQFPHFLRVSRTFSLPLISPDPNGPALAEYSRQARSSSLFLRSLLLRIPCMHRAIQRFLPSSIEKTDGVPGNLPGDFPAMVLISPQFRS